MGKKKKYKIWVEPTDNKVDPRVPQLLRPVVLDHALLDNITHPSVGEMSHDAYVKDLAARLSDPVASVLRGAGIQVSEKELQGVCRGTAGEVLVIRGLLEAIMIGEICLEDIKHLPFFKNYENYFRQTPDIVSRALYLAISVAIDGEISGDKDPRES